jgi:cysteine desulfurase
MVYLDNNASTQIDSRVLEGMMPYLTDQYANASSKHFFGGRSADAIKLARTQIASLLSCMDNEVIFTSGATEAINLALTGIVEQSSSQRKNIVTLTTEHSAILDTCRYLEQKGVEITYLSVESDGLVDLNILQNVISNDTLLVCVMLVNNETGIIHPIKEISEIAHSQGAYFMTDATQALGKIEVPVVDMGIDLMAFSGHKFYGPKGVGGLYIRDAGRNNLKINAQLHGGGHERGFRSGTLNVPGIVGMGIAAEIARQDMIDDAHRVGMLRNYLEKELLILEGTVLNGHSEKRLYNVTNICFKGIDSDTIMLRLKDIAVSNGSACSSNSLEPSHVLSAMGLSREDAYSSLRFSLGRFNTEEEIKQVVWQMHSLIPTLNST